MSDPVENIKEEQVFQSIINKKGLNKDDILNLNWDRFVVYVDLRQKGKVVQSGYNDFTLILKEHKGESKNRSLILVVSESSKLKLDNLLEIISRSKSLNLDFFLAIVDKYGDITYYNMSETRLSK
ncbi:ribonuclease BN [Sulfuracidifex metallicus]|uniref:Ribonuclease BN n=1 Tax=Sulfuracidifex metallicus DSM 6482 = JCM 9184 TaxID=523847 RepID=A0A6A9QS46_SULME|nr:ribonuclease BN [Sulfuracidifex metallicus DSM 6482 = JCM 9184]WOE50857.1 ribonuclease BN [Sulfuracidifex metallicus DSM 6482 = JCM 9184]